MSLPGMFQRIGAIAGRHETRFARARGKEAALAPFPTTAAVLEALSMTSRLSLDEQQEAVRALARLYRGERHSLWATLLMHAFRPMILALRARDRGAREDRDARVALAFLQAVARAPLEAQPVFIALKRATERVLFTGVKKEWAQGERMVGFEALGERDSGPEVWGEGGVFGTVLGREVARRVLAGGPGAAWSYGA